MTTQTIHHNGIFPLTFDWTLERGNTLCTAVLFSPAVDFEDKTLLWLIQRDDTPVLALQLSADATSSRVWVENGKLCLGLQVAHSRQLKPYAYRHALIVKDTTGNYTTLLQGQLKVTQAARIWNDAAQTDNANGGTTGANGGATTGGGNSGTLDLSNLNLNIDPNGLQALIDANNNLGGLISQILITPPQ